MKKEPPDVLVFFPEKDGPLQKWIDLAEYAERVGNMWLFGRAIEKIKIIESRRNSLADL